ERLEGAVVALLPGVQVGGDVLAARLGHAAMIQAPTAPRGRSVEGDGGPARAARRRRSVTEARRRGGGLASSQRHGVGTEAAKGGSRGQAAIEANAGRRARPPRRVRAAPTAAVSVAGA